MGETVYEIIILLFFLAIGTYMLVCWLRTRKALKYKDRMWSAYRMIFLICCLTSLFFLLLGGNDIWGFIRLASTVYCTVMFLLNRDGIGDDGIVTMGSLTPWKELQVWDYGYDGKKKFYLFLEVKKEKESSPHLWTITFDREQGEEILSFMRQKQGKKYRRMKK